MLLELQSWSVDDLVNKFDLSLVRPVVDGRVLPASPAQLYRDNMVAPVPYLCGFNSHECYTFYYVLAKGDTRRSMEGARKVFRTGLGMLGGPKSKESGEAFNQGLLDSYYSDVDDGKRDDIWSRTVDLFSDIMFKKPAVDIITLHSGKSVLCTNIIHYIIDNAFLIANTYN